MPQGVINVNLYKSLKNVATKAFNAVKSAVTSLFGRKQRQVPAEPTYKSTIETVKPAEQVTVETVRATIEDATPSPIPQRTGEAAAQPVHRPEPTPTTPRETPAEQQREELGNLINANPAIASYINRLGERMGLRATGGRDITEQRLLGIAARMGMTPLDAVHAIMKDPRFNYAHYAASYEEHGKNASASNVDSSSEERYAMEGSITMGDAFDIAYATLDASALGL